MQKFKNLYFGIVAILFAFALFLVFLFKNNSILISATDLQTITQNALPEVATIQGDYLYFTLDGKEYKVAKSSIDLQEFGKKVPLEIKNNFNILQNLTEIIIIFIASMILLFLFASFKNQNLKISPTFKNIKIPKIPMKMLQNLLQ